jgi:hypothetical protein
MNVGVIGAGCVGALPSGCIAAGLTVASVGMPVGQQ